MTTRGLNLRMNACRRAKMPGSGVVGKVDMERVGVGEVGDERGIQGPDAVDHHRGIGVLAGIPLDAVPGAGPHFGFIINALGQHMAVGPLVKGIVQKVPCAPGGAALEPEKLRLHPRKPRWLAKAIVIGAKDPHVNAQAAADGRPRKRFRTPQVAVTGGAGLSVIKASTARREGLRETLSSTVAQRCLRRGKSTRRDGCPGSPEHVFQDVVEAAGEIPVRVVGPGFRHGS